MAYPPPRPLLEHPSYEYIGQRVHWGPPGLTGHVSNGDFGPSQTFCVMMQKKARMDGHNCGSQVHFLPWHSPISSLEKLYER